MVLNMPHQNREHHLSETSAALGAKIRLVIDSAQLKLFDELYDTLHNMGPAFALLRSGKLCKFAAKLGGHHTHSLCG